jgi:hypothetical protein
MAESGDPFLGQPSAAIMLLGTFHFQDRGLDTYKPRYGFDVFAAKRQAEIADVVEQLAAYRPTKVAVERRLEQQEETDRAYKAYLRGECELPGNEVYQLGFRLAKRLGHTGVYCVDAWGRYCEPPIDVEAYAVEHGQDYEQLEMLLAPHSPEAYAREHHQEHLLAQWTPRYEKAYAQVDLQKMQRTLQELLLGANAEESLLRSHGHYLVDSFKVGTGHAYPGADWVTAWYNRNLRIFANLQRITTLPNERLLLVIGAGHVPILRHCTQASPEYQLVEVREYLRAGETGTHKPHP